MGLFDGLIDNFDAESVRDAGRRLAGTVDQGRNDRNRVSVRKLEGMTTAELWGAAQRALDRPERAPTLDLRGIAAAALDVAIGPDLDAVEAAREAAARLSPDARRAKLNELREAADESMTAAVVELRRAAATRGERPAPRGVIDVLTANAGKLHAYALEALGRNADFAGAALETLADRMLRTARKAMRNAAGAFEDFWGVSPGGLLGGLGLGTLALVALGAVVLLTPGGQAALFGWGSQAASAGKASVLLGGRLGSAAVRFAK